MYNQYDKQEIDEFLSALFHLEQVVRRDCCIYLVTDVEVNLATAPFQHNRFPGPDGLPPNVLKAMADGDEDDDRDHLGPARFHRIIRAHSLWARR